MKIGKQLKTLSFIACFALLMVIQPASSVPFKLSANKSSYKSALIGKWDVDTRIMWSDCPFVKVGKTANSQLVFSDVNGRVVPHWKANQWKLVRNNAIEFDYDADTLQQWHSNVLINDASLGEDINARLDIELRK